VRRAAENGFDALRPAGAADRGLRYVFVVTYGRSGSTLVQGLLNALPGTIVRGENNFYVLPLFRSLALVRAFQELHREHNQVDTTSAFFGLDQIHEADFVTATRELLTRHMLGSADPSTVQVLGFKEVLWHRIRRTETEPFFAFLDDVFPGARYVLNERSHEQVVTSGFWRTAKPEEALQAINRVEVIQEHLRKTRPDRVLDVRYEQLTSADRAQSDAALRSLAMFVHGSCDDPLLARLRERLAVGHGPRPFGQSREDPPRRQR
jgi:hypothetical protein